MITTFKYNQTKANNIQVKLELTYSKSGSQLHPETYKKLMDLAKEIKEQFNKEETK